MKTILLGIMRKLPIYAEFDVNYVSNLISQHKSRSFKIIFTSSFC